MRHGFLRSLAAAVFPDLLFSCLTLFPFAPSILPRSPFLLPSTTPPILSLYVFPIIFHNFLTLFYPFFQASTWLAHSTSCPRSVVAAAHLPLLSLLCDCIPFWLQNYHPPIPPITHTHTHACTHAVLLFLFQLSARLPQPKLFSCNCSKPNNYSLSERINFLISHKDV